ncbi:hypothetical protein AB0M34_04945 [Nocardia sp. NPDC050193]
MTTPEKKTPEKKGKLDSGGDRPKDVRPRLARRPAPAEPEALDILDELAARHRLRITGFADSGIDAQAAREIAAAVDDVLGRHQSVDLAGLAVVALPNGQVSCVRWEERADPPSGGWIVFQQLFADASDARARVPAGGRWPGSAVAGKVLERPMYTIVVHNLGELLVDSAGPDITRRAERTMITEYHRISGPWHGDTLAAVVRGYRDWRSQLGSAGSATGPLDPRSMLAAGFTEVELRPDTACGPAKVLHRVLVETMRGRPVH